MQGREEGPNALLNAFRLLGEDEVRWALREELIGRPLMKPHGIPFGQLAGSKPVVGRGKLTRHLAFNLLTSDIALALSLGVRDQQFWWNYGGSPPDGDASPDDPAHVAIILSTWRLDGRGTLRWIGSPHRTIEPDSIANGTRLAGRGDAALSYKGTIYVSSDVRHVLTRGRLPWQLEVQWD